MPPNSVEEGSINTYINILHFDRRYSRFRIMNMLVYCLIHLNHAMYPAPFIALVHHYVLSYLQLVVLLSISIGVGQDGSNNIRGVSEDLDDLLSDTFGCLGCNTGRGSAGIGSNG